MPASNRTRALSLLLGALLLLPAYATSQSPNVIVEERNRIFVEGFAKKSPSLIASVYLESGRVSRSGPSGFDSARSRESIEDFWRGAIGAGITSVQVTTKDATLAGDIITETGTYVMKVADGKVRSQGTYRTIWRKAGATWLIQENAWTESRQPL